MINQLTAETVELLSSTPLCPKETQRVISLQDKLENHQLTISVIGQFKRGKSSLVNTMLGDQILPVGIVPVTSLVTLIQYGETHCQVHYDNGLIKSIPLEELENYLCVLNDPKNNMGIHSVTMNAPSDFLKDGFTLVDTPGVGSIHHHNSVAAYDFVKESDGVIFMLSVDSPINEIEVDFLKKAKEYAGKFYFAVNKIDTISQEDLKTYLAYCEDLLSRIMEVPSLSIHPISAATGQGVEELKAMIKEDCKTRANTILSLSSQLKLYDIVTSSLSQIGLYRNAFNLPFGILGKRLKKIQGTIDQIQEEGLASLSLITKKEAEIASLIQTSLASYMSVSLGKNFIDENRQQLFQQMELEVNQMRTKLGTAVSEAFDMNYDYALTQLSEKTTPSLSTFENQEHPQESSEKTEKVLLEYLHQSFYHLTASFKEEMLDLCQQLTTTLDEIFLYSEKNSITIAYQMEDLYKLVRKLRRIRQLLDKEIRF